MTFPAPRRAAGLVRYVFLALAIVLVLGFLRHHHLRAAGDTSAYLPSWGTNLPLSSPIPVAPLQPETQTLGTQAPETKAPVAQKPAAKGQPTALTHPIDELIQDAEKSFAELLKQESKDLKSAAAEYRKKRGRHPPPGFDTWFKFAQEHGAVMVEDFFDQIYHDLGPFWGMPASTMRKEAWDYEMTIHIRDNNATTGSAWFWTQIWLDLTKTIQHMLPDMSLALNAMDEPRIVAPWETVNEYMEIERSTRSMEPANEVVTEFQKLKAPGTGQDEDVVTRPKNWEDTRKLGQRFVSFIC
jgi:hypothetical protein